MQSFLNLIDLATGRQIRLAELGFKAESPSFSDDGITFERDGELYKFDIDTGRITKPAICIKQPHAEQTSTSNVKLNFISEKVNGIGHCELIADGKVAARFMGSDKSIGECPEKDGRVVFFGYPSPEGIN